MNCLFADDLKGAHIEVESLEGTFIEKLEACEVSLFKIDPCLVVGDKVICMFYVDDLMLSSKDLALF